jgi:hypothetical protein
MKENPSHTHTMANILALWVRVSPKYQSDALQMHTTLSLPYEILA